MINRCPSFMRPHIGRKFQFCEGRFYQLFGKSGHEILGEFLTRLRKSDLEERFELLVIE